jgi:hypothetical protein
MRVCRRKSDGFIIEGQSNDAASLDVLLQNAINAGYAAEDVEVIIMDDNEFYAQL